MQYSWVQQLTALAGEISNWYAAGTARRAAERKDGTGRAAGRQSQNQPSRGMLVCSCCGALPRTLGKKSTCRAARTLLGPPTGRRGLFRAVAWDASLHTMSEQQEMQDASTVQQRILAHRHDVFSSSGDHSRRSVVPADQGVDAEFPPFSRPIPSTDSHSPVRLLISFI